MKRLISLLAFLCAYLPGGDLVWAQDFVVLEHRITDGAELCSVIDPSDNVYGLDDDGHPLGLGVSWTDVATGYPDLRTERSLAFAVPGVNPEGAGTYPHDHAGDPSRLMIRLDIKERRWCGWENLSPTPIMGRVPMTHQNTYQLARNTSPYNPSYELISTNFGSHGTWDWWQPPTLAAFDGALDGEGPSGWRFACGPLYFHQPQSEWCEFGSWDYHTMSSVTFLDWADLSYNDKQAWRTGHTERLKYQTRQYMNANFGQTTPADGPDLQATNHHGWAIEWGNRPTVDVTIIALD